MPPISKELEGHIASDSFVRPCVRVLHFLMHDTTSEPCMLGFLKFHIWIPQDKITDTYFVFLSGLCPFPELWPLEKKLNEILSAKYLKMY